MHRPSQFSLHRRVLAAALCLLPVTATAAAGVDWQKPVEVAAGRGERGPWQQNESRYDYVDDPTVALDDAGNAAVAWVDQGKKDIFFQRFAPDGSRLPADPVNVSRSPQTFSWLPRLAQPSSSRILVLWQEIIFSGGSHGGDILFARSVDAGKHFDPPLNLSQSVAGDGKGRINRRFWHNGSLDLAVGPEDVVYATWTNYEGELLFCRSTDGGGSFTKPFAIAADLARPARGPALAVAGEKVFLSWTVGEERGADIRLAISSDAGKSFSPARIVARTAGYSDAPRLAVSADGALHLVFADSPGGPFARPRILYAKSVDAGRSFNPPRVVSDPAPVVFAGGAGFPSIEIAADGALIVSWDLFVGRKSRPSGQALAISRNGGLTFTRPEVVPGTASPAGGSNGSQQGLLMRKWAVDNTGAIAVVNSVLLPDRGSRIWLLRGTMGAVRGRAKPRGRRADPG